MVMSLMYFVFKFSSVFRIPKAWADCAMPIYLMHAICIILLAGVCSFVHQKQFYHSSLLAFVLKLVLSVGFAVLAGRFLRRSFPRTHAVLLGGRG